MIEHDVPGIPRLGLISDTHGLLRPEAVDFLAGCELIVHAGDIGRPGIISELEKIAPVISIKGNVDTGSWSDDIPLTCHFQWHGKSFFVIHNIHEINPEAVRQCDVVIYGHSHQPKAYQQDGALYFNPGSAGPRRFRLPISLGEISFQKHELIAQHHTIIP